MKWAWIALALVGCAKKQSYEDGVAAMCGGNEVTNGDVKMIVENVKTGRDVGLQQLQQALAQAKLPRAKCALAQKVMPEIVIRGEAVEVLGEPTDKSAAQLATDTNAAMLVGVRVQEVAQVRIGYTDQAMASEVLGVVAAVLGTANHTVLTIPLSNAVPAATCEWSPPPHDLDAGLPRLSVQLGTPIWIAMSRIDDFISATPANVGARLKEQKASAFFSDRKDIEVAADDGLHGPELTAGLAAVCAAGFTQLDARQKQQLSVRFGP